jgi:hypothetical protein
VWADSPYITDYEADELEVCLAGPSDIARDRGDFTRVSSSAHHGDSRSRHE